MLGIVRLWTCKSCDKQWTGNFRKVKMDCPCCYNPAEGIIVPAESVKLIKKKNSKTKLRQRG